MKSLTVSGTSPLVLKAVVVVVLVLAFTHSLLRFALGLVAIYVGYRLVTDLVQYARARHWDTGLRLLPLLPHLMLARFRERRSHAQHS